MTTDVEDIGLLQKAILTEARDEAAQIKSEAQAKADAIRARGREQAEAERKSILDRAKQEADRLRGQVVASAQLKARSLELEQREKLLDAVFVQARNQLTAISQRSDYDQIAAALLREALGQLKVTEAKVQADEATMKALKKGALEAISKELHGEFSLGPALAEGTGVVVEAAGGKLQYDNTLETRLNRLQSTLRASVYKILTGDKA